MLLIVAVTLSQATGLLLVKRAPIFSRTFTAPTNFMVSIQPNSSSTSTYKSNVPPRSSFTEKQKVWGKVGLVYSNNCPSLTKYLILVILPPFPLLVLSVKQNKFFSKHCSYKFCSFNLILGDSRTTKFNVDVHLVPLMVVM